MSTQLLLALLAAGYPSVATCLGDSITAGTHVTTPFPSKLQTTLGTTQWTINNLGVSGNTVSQMQARLPANQDVLIFLGGVNDLAPPNLASASTIWTTIKSIVDTARGNGSQVILMTVTPYAGFVNWSSAQQTQLASLNASIAAYANASKVIVLDTYTLLGQSGSPTFLATAYDSGDGLHPNQAGSDLIAAQLALLLPQGIHADVASQCKTTLGLICDFLNASSSRVTLKGQSSGWWSVQ